MVTGWKNLPPWTVELRMRGPTRASSSAIHPPLAYRVESHRAGTHTTHRQASSLLTHHSPRIRGTYSSTAVTVGQYLTSGLLHHTRQSVSARGPHLLTSLASTTHSCRSTCKAKQSSLPFVLLAYLSIYRYSNVRTTNALFPLQRNRPCFSRTQASQTAASHHDGRASSADVLHLYLRSRTYLQVEYCG